MPRNKKLLYNLPFNLGILSLLGLSLLYVLSSFEVDFHWMAMTHESYWSYIGEAISILLMLVGIVLLTRVVVLIKSKKPSDSRAKAAYAMHLITLGLIMLLFVGLDLIYTTFLGNNFWLIALTAGGVFSFITGFLLDNNSNLAAKKQLGNDPFI